MFPTRTSYVRLFVFTLNLKAFKHDHKHSNVNIVSLAICCFCKVRGGDSIFPRECIMNPLCRITLYSEISSSLCPSSISNLSSC